MHKVTFHNLGNADCISIDTASDKKILFDYAHMGDADDDEDLRCNLPAVLREDLGERDHYDVVAFTHLDRDHYARATEFFYFGHIKAYQGDVDGCRRIKMEVMWVPAAVITEKLKHDADAEAKAIQKEARERFKAKKGIRVFSRPDRLKKWCEDNEVDIDERRHLITDAGQLTPEFSIREDGVEFFAHSPFAVRQDGNTVEDRNCDALVMHATFVVDDHVTRLFLASDADHSVLTDIVKVTESKKNEVRLAWDLFKLPHHCSHHSLSSQERNGDKSVPEPKVERLFEHYGQTGAIVVSTSAPIPAKGSEEDKKGANPPHRQAANYYREDVVESSGDFKVTMEHPSQSRPEPLVIGIGPLGTMIKKATRSAGFVAATTRPPRAG
jgi:hypothetical protein